MDNTNNSMYKCNTHFKYGSPINNFCKKIINDMYHITVSANK